MTVRIALTIFDSAGKNVQACYVRQLEGSAIPDTKNSDSLIEWIDDFLVADKVRSFEVDEFSPFGKWMKVRYEDGTINNQMLLTWEHFQ